MFLCEDISRLLNVIGRSVTVLYLLNVMNRLSVHSISLNFFTLGFKQLELLSFMLVEHCLVQYEMLKFPPSFIAAASIYTAQATLYGVQQWSKTCEHHTSYSEDQLL